MAITVNQLEKDAQKILTSVGEFIGYKGRQQLKWDHQLRSDNVSRHRIRKFFGFEILINSAPMRFIRQNWLPKSLRSFVYKKFTLSERPTISPQNIARLKAIFREDLLYIQKALNVAIMDGTSDLHFIKEDQWLVEN